ncbi:unnamed protein product [Arabidopsis lyrata]|nr:unnamed protein product [Arabidopsis lyrata]
MVPCLEMVLRGLIFYQVFASGDDEDFASGNLCNRLGHPGRTGSDTPEVMGSGTPGRLGSGTSEVMGSGTPEVMGSGTRAD